MSAFEEQKRMILPFLQRAEEIEKHDPKVAWYCRMHALETALSFPKSERDPRINDLIKSVVATVEKTKEKAGIANRDADKAYMEDFALKVFNRADRVDRAGMADKKTAVSFFAAFYFFETLTQFGELADDIAEKQRYAAWKAADINKAIREGRKPTAGPAGSGMMESDELPTPPGFMSTIGEEQPSDASAPRDDSLGLPQPPARPPGAPGPPSFTFDTQGTAGHLGGPQGPPSSSAGADDDDFGLPDVPAGPPAGAHTGAPHDAAPSASAVNLPGTLPAMQAGSKILYAPNKSTAPVRGTVARVADDGHTLYVALPDKIVPCQRQQLVYEVVAGDTATYHHDGVVEGCMVQAVDCGHWPPSCAILLPGGNLKDVSGENIAPTNLPPPAQKTPPPPSAAATGPGAASGALPGAPTDVRSPSTGAGYPTISAVPPPPSGGPSRAPQGPSGGAPAGPTSPAGAHPYGNAGVPAGAPAIPAAVPVFQPSLKEISEAHKQAKYALSSLSFEDVPTAVKHLTNALKLLTSPQ